MTYKDYSRNRKLKNKNSSKNRKEPSPATPQREPSHFEEKYSRTLKTFTDQAKRSDTFEDLQSTFNTRAAPLFEQLLTRHPTIAAKLLKINPLTNHRIIADKNLSFETVRSLHAVGSISSIRVIGTGMKNKDILSAMSREGYRAIFTTKKDGKNSLPSLVKRAQRSQTFVDSNHFNRMQMPLIIVIPDDPQQAELLIQKRKEDIHHFLQSPNNATLLDLSDQSAPSEERLLNPQSSYNSLEDEAYKNLEEQYQAFNRPMNLA